MAHTSGGGLGGKRKQKHEKEWTSEKDFGLLLSNPRKASEGNKAQPKQEEEEEEEEEEEKQQATLASNGSAATGMHDPLRGGGRYH